MDPLTLLVISSPKYPFLRHLERLPSNVHVLTGDNIDFLKLHAPHADVILNGFHDGTSLRAIFPLAAKLRWVHTLSAGVEKVLFPELIESPIPFTNGRAVFGPGLAEFTVAAMFFFAKDLRRLTRQQQAGRWEQFDVQLLRDQVLGVVGYGGVGQESGRLAHALGMRVMALRRRKALSEADPILERSFEPAELREMLPLCDFVLLATPLTPETRGMIGEAEFEAMKNSAVIINVGRGPVIVESAMVTALTTGRIRGAALDVFDHEPLPSGHPFYSMENVLFSPHCADHTVGWMELAVNQFITNFEHFLAGQPLENIVDKRAGY